MSKRPRLGGGCGRSDASVEESDEHPPPLSPPLHHIPLPDVDTSLSSQPGFDPIGSTAPLDLAEPCWLPPPFQHMESPTSQLSDMGHVTPAFPDFDQIPSPEVVERDVMSLDVSSSVTSYDEVRFDTDVENVIQPTEIAMDSTLASSSLTMDMNGDDEEPFHDAFDYFTTYHETFCEEVDPAHHLNQEDKETDFSDMFFETEQFYDAFDAAPPLSSDQAYQQGADVPLYEGAKVTLHDAATALMTFLLGCKISGAVFSHLLSLLNLLLPENHKLFKTIHTFYKHFEDIKSPLNLIIFCSICCQSLETKDSLCTNCKSQTKVGFYIHVPLADQLKRLYARPGFTNLLSYRHHRSKTCSENYEDIYDGEVYKSFAANMGPLDISCMWNTDGISLYSSSSFQVWPFYFSINELPPHLRHKEENILLGGIAFGYEKPHPNLLMKPIYDEVKLLQTKGIDVVVPDSTSPVNIKCNVLCGSSDAPAKACFMRMTQFNGHYGCHMCFAKGEKSERTGNVFVYPFEDVLELRTREQYKVDVVDQAHGIKGPTYLFYMLWSFFLSSTAFDVMHCVYLGICRQIFTLYLSSEHIKQVFGANAERKALLATLSELFCSFNPPHYFSRPPRDLKHVKYFKASEFRVWLFSTALPVFEKYMKEPYLSHFKKLVCAICHLNQSSVSLNDIVVARQLLKSFVQQWQELFSLRQMSYNVHCLLHLPDVVQQLGPLWVSSCFGYENINGVLARLVHGTRYAGLQIQTNLGLLRNVPKLINSLVNSDVKMFCQSAMSHHNRLAVTEKLDANTYVIGKFQEDHHIDPVYLRILEKAFPNITPYFFFRLKKTGFLYVSKDYDRGVRDSSNIKYSFQNSIFYGCIKVFVKIEQQYYAVIHRYVTSYPFYVDQPVRAVILSLLKCSVTEQVDIVPVVDLQCVCFKMCVDSITYISPPLNFQEIE
ncbi:hypothetical protein FOCC_FOCC017241 [Frankliniella occidentalis]|nr:hypothetical protein FOCC_FOCC017241 [Frankliniella occidentalis]